MNLRQCEKLAKSFKTDREKIVFFRRHPHIGYPIPYYYILLKKCSGIWEEVEGTQERLKSKVGGYTWWKQYGILRV